MVVLYEGHCGRVRDGEEDAEQAYERDPDEAGGVRVHQDPHLPRVRHSQGATQATSSHGAVTGIHRLRNWIHT